MNETGDKISDANKNVAGSRMHTVCDLAIEKLSAAFMHVRTNDNIMSSVIIQGSHTKREDWVSGIYHNSKSFLFMITPAKGKRYYEPGENITVDLHNCHYANKTKFRKSTTTPEKAIQRIQDWIEKTSQV